QEDIPGIVELNQALRPYWRDLWRVAARGHYFIHNEPIREENNSLEEVLKPPIPTIREVGYSLAFQRAKGDDLLLLLSWPGPRGTMYPLSVYPIISEFRSMLAALDPKEGAQQWQRQHFYGYINEFDDGLNVWFRNRNNGITFGFTEEEWNAVRELFR